MLLSFQIFLKKDPPLDVFKLGDFGLVTKKVGGKDVEEGDSRYMSMELLGGDHEDLTKSDIFSLGCTMYEICVGRELPVSASCALFSFRVISRGAAILQICFETSDERLRMASNQSRLSSATARNAI